MAAAKAPDEGWVAQLSKLIMSDLTASDRVDAELQRASSTAENAGALAASANLSNALRGYTQGVLAIAAERAGADAGAAHRGAQLAQHLLKRANHNLLDCGASFGSDKVAAFRTLLLRTKFWVAGWGVCAQIAAGAVLPGAQHLTALFDGRDCLWRGAAYDMWHIARHYKAALEHDPLLSFPETVFDALNRIMATLASDRVWRDGEIYEALAFETHAREHMSTELTRAIALAMPLTSFLRSLLGTTAAHVAQAGCSLLVASKVDSRAVPRVLSFMLACVDLFFAKSLHLLLGRHAACFCVLPVFTALKAAAHRSLRLVRDEDVRMTACVREVVIACGLDADAAGGLKQECVQLYNDTIIVSHNEYIRTWIDKEATATVSAARG